MKAKFDEDRRYNCVSGTCMDHSGIATRMNLGIGLLTVLCGLFSYSSFVQLPALERRIGGKMASIERNMDKMQNEIVALKMEDVRIKTQRNADHPKKDALQ